MFLVIYVQQSSLMQCITAFEKSISTLIMYMRSNIMQTHTHTQRRRYQSVVYCHT